MIFAHNSSQRLGCQLQPYTIIYILQVHTLAFNHEHTYIKQQSLPSQISFIDLFQYDSTHFLFIYYMMTKSTLFFFLFIFVYKLSLNRVFSSSIVFSLLTVP
ncbi:hypothetical protein BDC45DRAFT_608022, partial [Circinella umbellata]